MAKKRGKHSSIWSSQPVAANRPVDLEILGCGVRTLPPPYWEPSMLFRGASDLRLREITGTFPFTFRPDHRSHPLFVLESLPGLGLRVCPCSSKNYGALRRIRKGCILLLTRREVDRDSHLVESCAFTMPMDPSFWESLSFLGSVPPECLEDCSR